MITQTNAFVVVLDTCVLAPMPLCDTLLRLAEDPAFYMPRWSAGILEELRRVLLRMQYSDAQAERRITAMQTAFEDACVTGYAELIPSMTNDEKDRHVLAAAVRAGAHAILTENVKHFPAESVEPYNIDVLTPDQFLAHQFHLNRGSAGRETARPGDGSRDSLRGSGSQTGEVGAVAAQPAPGIRVAT